jgi:O-antigen/teichoic acid export membrane protein
MTATTGDVLVEPPSTRGLGLRTTALPMAATRVVGLGGEFVTFALLARDLGPGGFGRVSAAFVVARYLGIVADWGATLGGSRLLATADPDWSRIRKLVRWRLAVSLGLAAALAVVLGAISPALVPISATVVCRGLNRDWVSLGVGKGARSGASSVVQSAGLLVAAVAILDGSVAAAAWALAAGYAVGAAASILLNRLPAGGSSANGAGTRVARDPWMAVMQVADQLLLTADTVLLVVLASAHAAGIYAAVCRISSALLTAQGLVVAGLVPGVTRALAGAGPDVVAALRRRCLRTGRRVAAAVLLAAVPSLWVLPAVFGDAFEEGRTALLVLLAAVAMSACTVTLFPVVLGTGRDRRLAVVTAVVAVGNVLANLVVIPRWSFDGAAVVMLVSQCAISANYLLMTRSVSRRAA